MNKLKVYWFGYGGHAHLAEKFRPIVEKLDMTLTTIHEWDNADIAWNRITWLNELRNADIIILPTNDQQFAKSNNKLTQSLSIGKPVICSSLPAYVRIAEKYPESFILIDDLTESKWIEALTSLKDKKLRNKLSEKALIAAEEYSIDNIGNQWLDTLQNLEKVDIIIPTYNNLLCLQLCLDSIRACTTVLYNLIIVNNGQNEDVDNYLQQQGDIVYVKKENLNFAQAINLGIKASSSKYVCLLNDDTIVSKGWLKKLIDSCNDDVGAVGVLSNCDKIWLHKHDIVINDTNLLPGTNTIDEIEPILKGIYSYETGLKNIIERDWIAFYCTFIPRKVINEVGMLDEKFINSGEDVDYCNRIVKQGYKIIQNFDSFVFHFGAVGRKILESENKKKYHENDTYTQNYLKEKWDKQNVVIYTGPAWERWDFRNAENGGIGGSEIWAIYLARELDALGYRVTVFVDCAESINDGNIRYLHYSEYDSYIEQNWIDYFISSRTTDTFRRPVRCSKAYVMIHDIWLLSDKNQVFLDKVDKFCVLSPWHKKFAGDYHNIPEEKLQLTTNGIYLDRFKKKKKIKKKNRLVYSSSPDRGLDTLLYLFPFIKSEVPDVELHVFYGFDNWSKSIDRNGDIAQRQAKDDILAALQQDGVINHGRVSQQQLAEEWLAAKVWAYPTRFTETFCITAIEAMAANCGIVTTKLAALETTVGDNGVLIDGDAYTQEYRTKFATEVIKMLTDDEYRNMFTSKAAEYVLQFSWQNTAQRWKDLFLA